MELKFLKGNSSAFETLEKNSNYFYIVTDNDVVSLYLGDVLLAKSTIDSDLTNEISRAKAAEADLQNQINSIDVTDIDLSGYYTKTEVDNIILNNITNVLNNPT